MKTFKFLLSAVLTLALVPCAMLAQDATGEPSTTSKGPVVATSVALDGPKYMDTKTFQERPVCREFAKRGLVMDYLLPLKADRPETWLTELKHYNVLWLMIDHEHFNKKLDPDKVGELLRQYVEEGGGLVIQHSPGRYPEAPCDPYWNKAMAHLDMTRLHEEIIDFTTVTNYGRRSVFYTDNIRKHPVTEGVPGLWLVARSNVNTGYGGTWGSHAIIYSNDWQSIVFAGPNGKSCRKHPLTNVIDYNDVGYYKTEPPVVAVRTLGKGRIVSIAIHKDTGAWMYGTDRWYNPMEHGEFAGRPSESMRLIENALAWAGEPSRTIAGFAADYAPHQDMTPPYKPSLKFGCVPGTSTEDNTGIKTPGWSPFECWNPERSRVTGVIGLHSSYSDGKSSVAEYAEEAKKLGLSFIVFTDPLAKLTSDKLEKLRADCVAVSDEKFYACPGVEYSDISGLDWILFHDKIAWPEGKITHGDYTYEVFKDGKITQRNNYGGHQNLYRGAVINGDAFDEKGIYGVNLAYFNGCIPHAYDGAKLIHDNEKQMLSTAHDLFRYSPMSYTRCLSAADLKTCRDTSVLVCDDLEGARKVCNVHGGWGGWAAGNATHSYVRCGGDIAINGWFIRLMHGTELVRLVYDVSSSDGISEITVCDGARRVLARIDAKGEKRFTGETDFSFDTQSVPQLIVRDKSGHIAYSGNEWAYYYHAGLHRCGDNSNLQGQRPMQVWFPNWDDVCTPINRERNGYGIHPRMISEANGWGADVPSSVPNLSFRALHTDVMLKGIDFPGEFHRPSCKTVFALMNPAFGAIVDQYVGDYRVCSTHSDIRSTYANTSVSCKDGENPYWRHHRRTFLLQDRRDTEWSQRWQKQPESYRGGCTVVEGEFKFMSDVTLSDSIAVVWYNVQKPNGEPVVFARGDMHAFGAGDYISPVADPDRRYALIGLPGSDPLVADLWGKGEERHVKLTIGQKGHAYKSGDVLRYRFAVLFQREAGEDEASIVTYADRIASVGGIETLAANDGMATKVVPEGDSFIQDLSIAVKGLADNGCAYVIYPDGRTIPMGFLDGVAYGAIPAELPGTYKFLNLFTCDDSALRFTFIPKMKGHAEAELVIDNPSDHAVKTTVRDVREAKSFDISLEPKSCKRVNIDLTCSKQ